MIYDDPVKATRAYNILREGFFDDKQLLAIILPNVQVCFHEKSFFFRQKSWVSGHFLAISQSKMVRFSFCKKPPCPAPLLENLWYLSTMEKLQYQTFEQWFASSVFLVMFFYVCHMFTELLSEPMFTKSQLFDRNKKSLKKLFVILTEFRCLQL